jgi:hypothetical protein
MNGPKRLFRRRLWLTAAGWLTVAGVALGGEGTVYTWKDAGGRVHYSNRPPPEGQPATPVELNAKPVKVQPTERIYTWTDAEGRIHYGPQPPPDVPAKELREDDSSLSTIRPGPLRPGEQQRWQELQKHQ